MFCTAIKNNILTETNGKKLLFHPICPFMNTYAIGDVQGCGQQMQFLLDRIYAESPQADIIFLGDLVNRGPQSLQTLRKIRSLGAKTILGNHDLHLLASAHGIRKPNGSDTLSDILTAPDCDDLLNWVRHRPLALFENGHLLVHAGVLPQWTAEQTMSLAHEVEMVLQGSHWINFLQEMYGNTPTHWNDTLTGVERLRCIVNALTRMRFCSADGTMNLKVNDPAEAAKYGQMPWFEVPGRKTQDVTVVFGHWSAMGLVMRPDVIGLDTGCVWGGKLTAMRLADRALVQVDCPQYREPDKS